MRENDGGKRERERGREKRRDKRAESRTRGRRRENMWLERIAVSKTEVILEGENRNIER